MSEPIDNKQNPNTPRFPVHEGEIIEPASRALPVNQRTTISIMSGIKRRGEQKRAWIMNFSQRTVPSPSELYWKLHCSQSQRPELGWRWQKDRGSGCLSPYPRWFIGTQVVCGCIKAKGMVGTRQNQREWQGWEGGLTVPPVLRCMKLGSLDASSTDTGVPVSHNRCCDT